MGVLVHPFEWKIFCNNHYAFSLFIFFLFFNLWYYNMHVSYQKLLGVSFWLFSMLNISISHAFPHWLSGPLTPEMRITVKKIAVFKTFSFQQTAFRKANTGCSLNIVFFLKIFWIFWTLSVLLQRWCSTCLACVHTLTSRENRVRKIY